MKSGMAIMPLNTLYLNVGFEVLKTVVKKIVIPVTDRGGP
jgi:hypothetical protein